MNAASITAYQAVPSKASIHPAASIGRVHYTVADLQRQASFYHHILGFKLLWQEGDTAALGVGEHELLRLTQVSGATPARRATGLYHTAFLVPTRWDLAHLLRQVAETNTPIQGHSNHGTHLALYLPDAEGNGIELAWDFPPEVWPMKDGKMRLEDMPRQGIDIPELLNELERDSSPWTGLAGETRVGHVHLHVADLAASESFYHQLLGFDVVLNSPNFGALFVSAGGYHHHIGMNIWNGAGAPPPPPGATGLRYYTITLPDVAALQRTVDHLQQAGTELSTTPEGMLLYDPSRNGILLTTSPASS
jgi:catechol 2,3-dioxygenase